MQTAMPHLLILFLLLPQKKKALARSPAGHPSRRRLSTTVREGIKAPPRKWISPKCEMVKDYPTAEPGATDEDQQPFIFIPTNQNGLEVAITDAMIHEYQALYPAVDVKQALREIRA